ncbi:MAG TPA: glycosyltransferase, partial [Phycisphaerae bacterium]|nr:glycosyltransferase [Phycisphaerae bacterium]
RFRDVANIRIITDPVVGFFQRLAGCAQPLELAVRALRRVTAVVGFDPLGRRLAWARRLRADVVYYPFHGHAPQHAHLPMVTTIHAILPEYGEKMMATIQAHVDTARAVVTSWPYPFEDLQERYALPAGRLFVVPFTAQQGAPSAAAADLARYGVTGDFYFYPAVITERKNHINLIRAYGRLRASGAQRRMVVCTGGGDAVLRQRLIREATELGVAESFRFLDYVPKEIMTALYDHCTATISPTLWEAGMATLQEGGAAGKPALCADIAPARAHAKLLNMDVCFFDPRDPDDIARKILAFERDAERYVTSAERVRDVIRGFDAAYTGSCYAEILSHAAGFSGIPAWAPYRPPSPATATVPLQDRSPAEKP